MEGVGATVMVTAKGDEVCPDDARKKLGEKGLELRPADVLKGYPDEPRIDCSIGHRQTLS
ncbi:MAG: hypothetical protein M3256_19085 [Actinomycetota bacterium]|nr:hypothetical protein [Actinomycetota bacterium]